MSEPQIREFKDMTDGEKFGMFLALMFFSAVIYLAVSGFFATSREIDEYNRLQKEKCQEFEMSLIQDVPIGCYNYFDLK